MRVWVDTETSGLDPTSDLILEVAAVGESDGVRFRSLANPGEEALERVKGCYALRVNGLTIEELRAAPPLEMVAETFKVWLRELGAVELWAYNTQFDSGFLAQKPWEISNLCWGGCVMKLVANGRRWPKLGDVAARMGLEFEGAAHSALADAKMAKRVHLELERQMAGRLV